MPKPKPITKARLLELLKDVPDEAVAFFFSGNETLEPATTVKVHKPGAKYYFAPARFPGVVWFELGEGQ